MSTVPMLLLIVAGFGILTVPSWIRFGPLYAENYSKTLIAFAFTIFAALGEGGLGLLHVPQWVTIMALIIGPLYIVGPTAIVYFARWGWHTVARTLLFALYWTQMGREPIADQAAHIALAEGEPDAARSYGSLTPHLPMRIALTEGNYEQVIATQNFDYSEFATAYSCMLKAEAYAKLGNIVQAEEQLRLARNQAPLGDVVLKTQEYRNAQAQVAAARGLPAEVHKHVGSGFSVFHYRDLMSKASENNGDERLAARLLADTEVRIPRGRRKEIAERIERLGGGEFMYPAPAPKAKATPIAIGVLALAYIGQVVVDQVIGVRQVFGVAFDASSVLAAYFLEIPPQLVPYVDAWWRFVTYAFVHGNIVHIGMNLWVMYDIGTLYERRRGWTALISSFLIGTIGGSYLTLLFDSGPLILVGASGGILGIAGALVADVVQARDEKDKRLLTGLSRWILILVVFSIAVPGVSLFGHLGGLIAGFAWGWLLTILPKNRVLHGVMGVASIAILAAALAQGIRLVWPFLV